MSKFPRPVWFAVGTVMPGNLTQARDAGSSRPTGEGTRHLYFGQDPDISILF